MTAASSTALFFIAILAPPPLSDHALGLTQMLGDRHQMRASKSPPHITLYAPFRWQMERTSDLEQTLKDFGSNQQRVMLQLSGFGRFGDRVLYIQVAKTPALLDLHQNLLDHLETRLGLVDPVARRRPFTPHLTLASKNVTRKTMQAAWQDLQPHAAEFEFWGDRLTLLHHRGDRWQIQAEFPFPASS
jgi:2'-5' RNA ligase